MNERQFTDETFRSEVLGSEKPVLVDLWAPWCAPCLAIAPVVEQLAREYDGRVVVGKLNTDENPDTPANLRVSAIPTLLFVKAGKIVELMVGAQPKAAIRARLEALLAA